MQIHFTDKNDKKQLTEFEILKLKANRMKLSSEEQQQLTRLRKGKEGEEMVVDFIQKYGHPNWMILRNLIFDEESTYEIDILVVGKMGCIAFEVKNYSGDFTYENGSCYYNQRPMTRDIVAQTRRIHLKNIQLFQRLHLNKNLYTALVFINEHNEITFNPLPESISVVKRNKLKTYIEHFAQQENQSYSRMSIEEQVEKLQRASVVNSKHLPLIDEMAYSEMKRGFYCPACLCFDLKRTNKTFICRCGHRQSVKAALLATIEEYSVLFHHKDLTRGDILHFINYELSDTTVYRVLRENFELQGKLKSASYINPNSIKT